MAHRVASLLLSACDGARATAAPKPADASVANNAFAGTRPAKGENLSTTLVELPAIPLCPGAKSIELAGIGTKLTVPGSVTVLYALDDSVKWRDTGFQSCRLCGEATLN